VLPIRYGSTHRPHKLAVGPWRHDWPMSITPRSGTVARPANQGRPSRPDNGGKLDRAIMSKMWALIMIPVRHASGLLTTSGEGVLLPELPGFTGVSADDQFSMIEIMPGDGHRM
jgi:hypothetical protein